MKEPPYINVAIFNPQSDSHKFFKALIDTGADMTCIPENIAQLLGLQVHTVIQLASKGGILKTNTYMVNIQIENNIFHNTVVVGLPDLAVPLVGWDILAEKPFFIANILFGQIGHFLKAVPSFKQSTILILGQDTTEIYRLHVIQKRLEHHGYTGVIVKDVSDIEIQSVEEKVNMLASLCRFIICENSTPSGHIDELKICALNRYVTAIIQEQGQGATMMQTDYPLDFSFMKTFTYSSLNEMDSAVDDSIEWAEIKIDERRKFFNQLYGWR